MSSFTEKIQNGEFQNEVDNFGKISRQTEKTPISKLLTKNVLNNQVPSIDEGSEKKESQFFDRLERSQIIPTQASRVVGPDSLNKSSTVFRSPQTSQRMIPLA